MKPIPVLTAKQFARFWSKVMVRGPNECWPWLACRKRGYGEVRIGFGHYVATRVAYKLATGADPGDLDVCHTCDNPPCCNPSHFFLGTQVDNNTDRDLKGRCTGQPGEANPNVALAESDIKAIIASKEPTRVLAARFGVSKSLIRQIRRRVIWRHVRV